MKKWEDIVKDIMEEPDSALPECVFAEFRARRAAGRDITRKTTRPLIWALATAVAAEYRILRAVWCSRTCRPAPPQETERS